MVPSAYHQGQTAKGDAFNAANIADFDKNVVSQMQHPAAE
jgi:hypothetical protein